MKTRAIACAIGVTCLLAAPGVGAQPAAQPAPQPAPAQLDPASAAPGSAPPTPGPPPSTLSSPTPPPPSKVAPTEREKVRPASSDERSADPRRVAGMEREAVESGDTGRGVGAVLLFPFRELFRGLFLTVDTLGELAQKAKFVSRMDNLLFPKPGEIAFVPTLFFQSRHPPSFGARMVAEGPRGNTTLAAASGGPNDVFVGSVVEWKLPSIYSLLTVDALYDERNNLEFLGVGQNPDGDHRNRFRADASSHDALYLEQRSRVVAALDRSVYGPVRVIASSSILLSRVDDAVGADGQALTRVFEATPIITGAKTAKVAYEELAVRASTRKRWEGAEPGAQAELYGGYGAGLDGTDVGYFGAGGRALAFIPIQRPTNTLSPRIVIDTVTPVSSSLPFTVLAGQPDFRGFDLRRDKTSMVLSLDYRWVVMRYAATRIFVDSATLAPTFGKLFTTVPRFAAGFGIDVFNPKTDLARFAVAASGDGVRVFASFGWSAAGGDRQHRN